MKSQLTCLLLLISSLTFAQMPTSSQLRTQIRDDQRTLSIQIDGNQAGRKLHYTQSFDVTGMNELQKEVLKYRVFASQGVTVSFSQLPYLLCTVIGLLVAGSILIAVIVRRSRKPLNSLFME